MEPSINLRDLEAQEQNSESLNEYLNLDNDTIIKMLLASQNENEKLHAILDKQTEKLDSRGEKAKAREERLNVRIDELTSVNTRSSENQIKLIPAC